MNTTIENIGFSLQKITTEQFAIIEAEIDKNKKISLGTQLRFGLDEENKIVGVFVSLKFDQEAIPFLIIETACHFKISNTTWDSLMNKSTRQSISFPQKMATHLAVIAVGTTRGVLHGKTENTKYNEFFLPTINVTNLVSEDLTFEFSNQ